jgi:alkylated DNA repair protein alkB family protein 1
MHRAAFEKLRGEADLAASIADQTALGKISLRARHELRRIDPKRRYVTVSAGKSKLAVGKASLEQLLSALGVAASQADRRLAKHSREGFTRVDQAMKRASELAAVRALEAFTAGTTDESWISALPAVFDPRAALSPAPPGHSGSDTVPVWKGPIADVASAECAAASSSAVPVPASGAIVGIKGCPGCYILPCALSAAEQDSWVQRCLTRYIEPEFERNIDVDGSAGASAASGVSSGIWSRACSRFGSKASTGACLASLRTITWSTVGLRYDWTTRSYDGLIRNSDDEPAMGPDGKPACSQPPREIREWAARVSRSVGMPMAPEAGIVNFYHTAPARCSGHESGVRPKAGSGNTMGGHKDDAELATGKPVVSMSLGCACVFLMGGLTRETEPVPILLRSGDVLVMGGPSRLRLHGIACVIPHTAPKELCASWGDGTSPALATELMQTMRININARQVFTE